MQNAAAANSKKPVNAFKTASLDNFYSYIKEDFWNENDSLYFDMKTKKGFKFSK